MTKIVINRPWISSFKFKEVPYGDTRLEQAHKLARNFACSLNLGCGNVNHVNVEGLVGTKDLYKQWVSDWKIVYREFSSIIRKMKSWRKTVHHPKLSEDELRFLDFLNRGSNLTPATTMHRLSEQHLGRLQETAQVLLNARYNAKLARAEMWRRESEARVHEEKAPAEVA